MNTSKGTDPNVPWPTAGTQCLPRLRRARSAFRAYGGHAVPSAPTADAQRLFAPTVFPTKANCEEFAFRSIGEALRKQAKTFLKTGSHRSALDMKKKGVEYRKGPSLGKTPGLGPRCLLGRTSGRDTPTADARRLSRLRRSLRKQTAIGFVLCST